MPDRSPLFSSPGATDAPVIEPVRVVRPTTVDLGLNMHGEQRKHANPGDELTVDPADRRRRARAALLDLRRDVIRRSAATNR
ncbi:hypothetical protein [Cellulosimicrobium marinum]|uniref:hypothetical protein n=1 Tax=Cellulosimicrobium marinum TaxID=1638992 RepID=UPI001E2EDF73|nr:hypothetical protein [Cellulosimicrobium marinum]MCB7135559.1 hypothetical protein [Cellulosimicrobium marinum]